MLPATLGLAPKGERASGGVAPRRGGVEKNAERPEADHDQCPKRFLLLVERLDVDAPDGAAQQDEIQQHRDRDRLAIDLDAVETEALQDVFHGLPDASPTDPGGVMGGS